MIAENIRIKYNERQKRQKTAVCVWAEAAVFCNLFSAVLSYIQDVRFSTLMQAAGMPASARCLQKSYRRERMYGAVSKELREI